MLERRSQPRGDDPLADLIETDDAPLP
jgi:hypothetical protein